MDTGSAVERGFRRVLAWMLLVGAVAYLSWRTATVVADASVGAVALLVVEALAWLGVAAFLLRVGVPYGGGRAATDGDDATPATTFVAVVAAGARVSDVERTMTSLGRGADAPPVLLVDHEERPAIAAIARAEGATVVTVADTSPPAIAAAVAPTVGDDDAVVVVAAGSLLAATALDALVAPMTDPQVGAVQGGLDWSDPATITVHGPSRDGLGVLVGREAPAAGRAGISPLLGDGYAFRARAVAGLAGPGSRDLTAALAGAGWTVRFAATPVVYRPRPASSTAWRAVRSRQVADGWRRAGAALRTSGLALAARARLLAGAGDVASAWARVGLVAIVTAALLSGTVPVPGPLGLTLLAAAALWALATALVVAHTAPVLRTGDHLRLGWHRLDADLFAPFRRDHAAAEGGGRVRALAAFPVSVLALVAVDAAAFVRGLALVRPSIVPGIATTLDRVTIGVFTVGVLALLVDSLRIFVARPDARIDLRVPARVAALVGTSPAELRDLSPAGAGLVATEALPRGTAVQLRFTLPDGQELALDGRVARSDDVVTAAGTSQHLLGVEFGAMDPETHRALVRYVVATAPGAAAAAAADSLPRSSSVPVPRPVLRFASVAAVVLACTSLLAAPAVAAPSDPTTTFAGTVTGPSGPFGGACVSAVNDSWGWWTSVSDGSGAYSIDAPAGTYRIQVNDCNPPDPTTRLAGGWWTPTGLTSHDSATTVTGNAGETSNPIDITLAEGGWFSGTVQDPDGTPLDGVCVTPVTPQNQWDGGTNTPSNGGPTGTFETATLQPGSYSLAINDCTDRARPIARGWVAADGTSTTALQQDARVFSLGTGDLDLGTVTAAFGTRITGTVHDDGGAPAPNVCVAALGDNWTWMGGGYTAADGTYATDPLPPGDWALSFHDCSSPQVLVDTFWNGTDASVRQLEDAPRIHVDGSTASLDGYDQTMIRGGSISGTLRSDAGPVAGACVGAARHDGGQWNWLAGTQTASDGTFTISGIAPGDVGVYVSQCSASLPIIEGFSPGPGQAVTRNDQTAATINVTAGGTTAGLDVLVTRGTTLAGTVRSGGAPLANACVRAVDPSNGDVGGSESSSDGSYRMTVAGGSYLVQASPCRSGAQVASLFLDGTVDPAAARRIDGSAGTDVTGLDFDLPAATPGTLTGRITASSGATPNACVVVVPIENEPVGFAQVAPDGTFSVPGILPGAYLVGIAGCDFPDDGIPPGATDGADPSVTYPLQWSSGVTIDPSNIWADPSWVVVNDGATTDIGTVCLQPCPDPTVTTPTTPDPTAVPTTPTTTPASPPSGTPTGFTTPTESTTTVTVPTSTGEAAVLSQPPTLTLAKRAIAPRPSAAAVADAARTQRARAHDAVVRTIASGHTQSAASHDSGDSGWSTWWWVFVLAAAVGAVAAGVPWWRSRHTT